ncbi:pseudoazurin [Defluviimonas salinarum]|uniref:Pseudoazurin n=1 Tax=Defluviimonas salinarum TaxID=2992147 RepID=A0ABT3J9N8_9RHOB|nr:pseudoazurin [Defluviimonas salinarum]MCW3784400.1 pseudoazurin [Defluviimonas salinarum]
MFKSLTAAALLAASSASAATIEVQMLNRGEAGAMVFEPAYVKAEPGDVIHFLPTDKGHNVENIDGMLPDGIETFKTKFGEEFSLTVDKEGIYGVKCSPHYTMGMVALIQVGEPTNRDAAEAADQKGKARDRFKELFAQVQ